MSEWFWVGAYAGAVLVGFAAVIVLTLLALWLAFLAVLVVANWLSTDEHLDQNRSPRRTDMNMNRRNVLKTAAWTAPVVTLATAAPAFATSPVRKDPGINGWVLINHGTSKGFDATFNSNPQPAPQTPDGAPFGLYLYDTVAGDLFSEGSITYWFRGKPDEINQTGSGWSSGTYVGTQSKPDGLTYHGYRFDYSGPFNRQGDIVWLNHLKVTAEDVDSDDATFWVERSVAINGQVYTFQRRNGERGPLGNGFPSSSRRSLSKASTGVLA